LILAIVEAARPSLGVFSLKRTVLSSVAITSAMLATKGLYSATCRRRRRLKANTTSCDRQGFAVMPLLAGAQHSIAVFGSTWITFSGRRGMGNRRGGPTLNQAVPVISWFGAP